MTRSKIKAKYRATGALGCLPSHIREARLQPLRGFASVIQDEVMNGSEGVSPFFDETADQEDEIASFFNLNTVTAADVRQGRREVQRATQRSLRERGAPARMTVYRYGVLKRVTNVGSITSVSLDPGVVVNGPPNDPVFVCEIDRARVLADIPAVTRTNFLEEELLVHPQDLQNCRQVTRAQLRAANRDFCEQRQRRKR
jgi:hypothetical protein